MTTKKPAATKAPAPKTRRGKITEAEHQKRIDEVRELLVKRQTKGEIKAALRSKYGVAHSTVERYMRAARECLLVELRDSRDWAAAQSLSAYTSILRDPTASNRDKILAQSRIDKLLGLCPPCQVVQTDLSGREIPPDEARSVLRGLYEKIRDRLEERGEPGFIEFAGMESMEDGPFVIDAEG